MKPYKLVNTFDFTEKAKDYGIDLRLSTRSSGLHVHWDYEGDPAQIKFIRRVFSRDGVIAVHHFKKIK